MAAIQNKKENKKFFEWLRKKNPKDLDVLTNSFHDKAFESIDCLNCGNCCTTTGPLLLNKDIERLARHFKQRPSEFSEKHLKTDSDGDYIFKAMPCPFLKADLYCSVYESRPNACREYPHTQQRQIYQKLNITYLNSMICPAVALVTEELKRHFAHQPR